MPYKELYILCIKHNTQFYGICLYIVYLPLLLLLTNIQRKNYKITHACKKGKTFKTTSLSEKHLLENI